MLPHFQIEFAGTLRRSILAALLVVISPSTLTAADAEPDSEPTAEQQADEKVSLQPILDLGRFQIRELHPVEGVTTNITLTLQLALNRQTSEATVDSLQHWHHRIRNQALIAIRTAETVNFAEPGLKRLRMLILLRVNRMFKLPLAEEVFFNEFTFTVH